MSIRKCLLPAILLAALSVAPAARADFTDTDWVVVGFQGEAWFANTQDIIGKSQAFQGGFADGVFYQCDFAGQSSTYTTYSTAEFLANPEFALFAPAAAGIGLSSTKVFVHRITCEGGGDASQRKVLYPFVTNEARKSAWYLFEGGVFELYAP